MQLCPAKFRRKRSVGVFLDHILSLLTVFALIPMYYAIRTGIRENVCAVFEAYVVLKRLLHCWAVVCLFFP